MTINLTGDAVKRFTDFLYYAGRHTEETAAAMGWYEDEFKYLLADLKRAAEEAAE